MQQNTKIHLN